MTRGGTPVALHVPVASGEALDGEPIGDIPGNVMFGFNSTGVG